MIPVRSLLLCLWADKVSSLAHPPVIAAALTCGYYFVWVAPGFRRSVTRLRTAIETVPIADLRPITTDVTSKAASSARRTAVIGAALIGLTGWPQPALAISCWLALMITILGYQLGHLGERVHGPLLGVTHLAVWALSPDLVAAADFLLLTVAFALSRRVWQTPSYSLFWRHA